jgi:tetratricopeptide (TPR) repeat protein
MKLTSPAGRGSKACRYRISTIAWFFTLTLFVFAVLPVFTQPAGIHVTRGQSRLSLYEYKEARKEFSRAIKIDPANAEAWYGRGLANGFLGHFKGAVSDLTEAIRLNPNYTDAYSNRGQARECLQDWKGAESDYARARELEGRKSDGIDLSGLARPKPLPLPVPRQKSREIRTQSDMLVVVNEYSLAMTEHASVADDYLGRGNAWMELREYQKAVDDFTVAIGIDPGRAMLWYRRGLARGMTGDFNGAIADFRKTLALDPSFPDAQANLEQAIECLSPESKTP